MNSRGDCSSCEGFLLLEALLSLSILLLLGTLIFSWYVHLVKGYQASSQAIQALYMARSIIEHVKANRAPNYSKKLWKVLINRSSDPHLPIYSVSVSVALCQTTLKNAPPLITLRTVYRL